MPSGHQNLKISSARKHLSVTDTVSAGVLTAASPEGSRDPPHNTPNMGTKGSIGLGSSSSQHLKQDWVTASKGQEELKN